MRSPLPRWWGAVVIVLVAFVGVGLFVLGGDGAADDGEGSAAPGGASTTIATGGIEIDAPDGWQSIPLPALGFGAALPPGWESVVLSDEGLSQLADAEPVVPGFVDAAHAAAQSGSVFYAAGVDGDDRVSDLKVRAAPDTDVTDAAGLEDFARTLADEAGLDDPTVTVVDDAEWPTVDVRYSTPSPGEGEAATEGTERSVLAPSGVVYSLLVTSEDATGHDDLADRLFATLAFSPPEG